MVRPAAITGLITAAVYVFYVIMIRPDALTRIFISICAVVILFSYIAVIIFHVKAGGKAVFLLSSAVIAGLWILIVSLSYPFIIRDTSDISLSITVFNGSSSVKTLKSVAYLCVPAIILFVFYNIVLYRSMAGNIKGFNSKKGE